MPNPKILERIERALGVPGIVTSLVERLSPTDLQSLLLEVFRLRAQRQTPADVLSAYETNRFVRPSTTNPSRLLAWEQTALANLPVDVQPILLSPVCPLGTSSAIGLVDQNRVLSTIRNNEVVSDSTNVLALECAVRRRALLRTDPKSIVPVHLATNHRLLRTQFYNHPLALAHFSAFVMCSAGRHHGDLQFEIVTLLLHIRFYMRALRAFLGESVPLRLALTDFSEKDRRIRLTDQILAPVQAEFTNIECVMDEERTSARNYYGDLGFHIYAISDQPVELVDGGTVDWTQRLLNNARERCIISGIGSERLCTEFEDQ
jgi:hypothetical protein